MSLGVNLMLIVISAVLLATYWFFDTFIKGGQSKNKKETPDDLHVKKPFLTNREREFFYKLSGLLPAEISIMCQVRLVDVIAINPKYMINNKAYLGYFRRISQWHCDYVLIDKKFNVKGVIELDDSSHNRIDRIRRDKYFNLALSQADVKLARFKNVSDLNRSSLGMLID